MQRKFNVFLGDPHPQGIRSWFLWPTYANNSHRVG